MKRLLALLLVMMVNMAAFAEMCGCDEQILGYEHMFCEKYAKTDNVAVTNFHNIICKGNAFKVAFECQFWSECTKAGDKVNFEVPQAIYTREGTLLIPACSKVVGTVINIEKQRIPNKNARVYINFECIVLPDGSTAQLSAVPCTKDGALKEGPWHTTGKLAAYTVGLGIVGAGAGTGFAFIPNPAKLGVGYAIGIPVGTTVGLITGLITPGLKYHAKAGEMITIILCQDLWLDKQNDCPCGG